MRLGGKLIILFSIKKNLVGEVLFCYSLSVYEIVKIMILVVFGSC